ncbi:MAG: acyl-CoA dehydrogenase, partial [Desulfobacterales bacterium]|nr:acyl-CoA dehydrogenase [Desulfobacterales bacterium]
MAQEVADRRDQEFVLHEMLDVASFSEHEKFADFNKKTVDMILKEARNLVTKEVVPTRALGDEDNGHPEGCIHENGAVKVPKSYHKPYKLFCEGEWLAMSDNPEWGGQGMPHCVSIAPSEMFSGGNIAFMMYPGLTHGAAKIVEEFGTQEQKDLYLKKLFTGEWGGTMCLTEPDAGTDVGALTTTAKDNGDGTYTITGNKIFISGGDSDMVSNILHPVLARIEGAPAGTKGISLFAVPKYKLNADGTPGESN